MGEISQAERVKRWREAHPQAKRDIEKRYYHKTQKHKDRLARMKGRRCVHCDILLLSKYTTVGQRKFCDPCRDDPKLKQLRERVHNRRAYLRRLGKPIPKCLIAFMPCSRHK